MSKKQFLLAFLFNVLVIAGLYLYYTVIPVKIKVETKEVFKGEKIIHTCNDTKAASHFLYEAAKNTCKGQWTGQMTFNNEEEPTAICNH